MTRGHSPEPNLFCWTTFSCLAPRRSSCYVMSVFLSRTVWRRIGAEGDVRGAPEPRSHMRGPSRPLHKARAAAAHGPSWCAAAESPAPRQRSFKRAFIVARDASKMDNDSSKVNDVRMRRSATLGSHINHVVLSNDASTGQDLWMFHIWCS